MPGLVAIAQLEAAAQAAAFSCAGTAPGDTKESIRIASENALYAAAVKKFGAANKLVEQFGTEKNILSPRAPLGGSSSLVR